MFRSFVAYALLVGLGLSLAFCFAMMWLQGTVQATEPNTAIRAAELALCLLAALLGMERLISLARTMKPRAKERGEGLRRRILKRLLVGTQRGKVAMTQGLSRNDQL